MRDGYKFLGTMGLVFSLAEGVGPRFLPYPFQTEGKI